MKKIDKKAFDLNHIDELAYQDTSIHRLDPRAKVITSVVFIICVVSFHKYQVSGLIPFIIYPIVLLATGNIPIRIIVKRIILVAPFALFIGIFNPLLERETMLTFGTVAVSGGWVSFASIMVRFLLTVSVGLTLIAITGFSAVCLALEKLGTPQVFVMQLMFLYRYIYVLVDEALRVNRARALRVFHKNSLSIKIFGHMVGYLLLRTLDRAQRIHLAMNCRGFDGRIRVTRQMRMGVREIAFMLGWSTLFIVMRMFNIPVLIGNFISGYLA